MLTCISSFRDDDETRGHSLFCGLSAFLPWLRSALARSAHCASSLRRCSCKPVPPASPLTGAARVALGPEVPAYFSNKQDLVERIMHTAKDCQDPLWPLPLHQPYKKLLHSDHADINNCGSSGLGGAITAALFLEEFMVQSCPWVHIDLMAYNTKSSPGHPLGGEAMGLWTMAKVIADYFKE